MKKLLKSEICESVNNAHYALFTKKVKHFSLKKKKKKNINANVRLGSAKRAFRKPFRTLIFMICKSLYKIRTRLVSSGNFHRTQATPTK